MLEINKIDIIKQFTTKDDGVVCGVYKVETNGRDGVKEEVFIQHGDSIGVVTFCVDKPASECISIIRNDVKKEFLKVLDRS